MKNNKQPQHTQGELLQENRTLYILHETGKYYKGEKELTNKFYFSVQPDYARGVTDADAVEYATKIKKAVNIHDELLEALKYSRRFLKPTDVDTKYVDDIISKAEQK